MERMYVGGGAEDGGRRMGRMGRVDGTNERNETKRTNERMGWTGTGGKGEGIEMDRQGKLDRQDR